MCVSVCPCAPGTWTLICLSGCGIHFRQNECRQGRSLGSQSRLCRPCLHTAQTSSKLMGAGTGVAVGAAGGEDVPVLCPLTGAFPADSAGAGSALVLLLNPAGLAVLLVLQLASTTAPAEPLLASPPSLEGVGACVTLPIDSISSPFLVFPSIIMTAFSSLVSGCSLFCAEGTDSELLDVSISSPSLLSAIFLPLWTAGGRPA